MSASVFSARRGRPQCFAFALGFATTTMGCSSSDGSARVDVDDGGGGVAGVEPGQTSPSPCASPSEGRSPNDVPTPNDGPTVDTPAEPARPMPAVERDDDILEAPDPDEPSGCKRELAISTVNVTAPEPFDVIIVADHSGSLSWSRDDLSAGLQDFLSRVRGYDVRFFVLTPTQHGASSEEANSPLTGRNTVAWQDPATLIAYTDEVTSYSETCTDAAGQDVPCPTYPEPITFDFTLRGEWAFDMPGPVATVTPDMDEVSIQRERQRITDAILELGFGGSSDEQPICTLNRYIAQPTDVLPEHAVFLILSDEDDTSDPSRCVLGQEIRVTVNGSKRIFEMPGSGPWGIRKFNCTPLDDQGNVAGPPVPTQWNLGSCTRASECSASDLQAATDQCPVNHVMSDCIVTCEEINFVACRVDETEVMADACNSPITVDGQSYDNLLDYCTTQHPDATSWGSCINYEKDGVELQEIDLLPLLPGMTLSEMGSHFRRRADEAFGALGYSVELVAFAPEFECAPQAGQSYAERLAELVDSREHIFPICEEYSGALDKAEEFAGGLIPNDYPLTLKVGEQLSAVRVVALDGTVREVDPTDVSYDAATGALHFEAGVLRATDASLEVDVLGACVAR
jgi:hypothetical protein